jgi:hypothetical protein
MSEIFSLDVIIQGVTSISSGSNLNRHLYSDLHKMSLSMSLASFPSLTIELHEIARMDNINKGKSCIFRSSATSLLETLESFPLYICLISQRKR